MMRATVLVTMFAICWTSVEGQGRGPNLVVNPSFEQPVNGTWNRHAATLEQYGGDHTLGSVSLLCKDRKTTASGASQDLPTLVPGRGYELSADVRLLNNNITKLFQTFKATVTFHFNETAVRGVDAKKPEISEKPTCKGLTGATREKCLARLRSWKAAMKTRKEEEKQKKKEEKEEEKQKKKEEKEERQRKKMEQKKKKMEQKKKKMEQKKKKKEQKKEKLKQRKEKKEQKEAAKKAKQKAKEEKRKQKEKEKQDRQKEKERKSKSRDKRRKGRKRQAGSKRKENDQIGDYRNAADVPSSQLSDVTDHVIAAGGRSGREILSRRSRRRRQQRRRRVDPPVTRQRRGGSPASADDDELKPASGTIEEQGAYIIAWRAWVTPEKGWIKLKGNINAPMVEFKGSTLRIQGPDAGCSFLIDNVQFYEIEENANWMAESRVRIENHRKTNFTVSVTIPSSIPRADIDVQVRLKKHLFAFGSKVEDKYLRSSGKAARPFQDLFYTLFNWATLGSFKWKFDLGKSLFEPDFYKALEGLEKLREHGLKVRAHSIFWGVKKNVPDAVLNTSPDELREVCDFHTEYMVNITRGRVEHWDVQNELLHGHWYEETLRDPNFSKEVFSEVRRLDPYPKRYLNDFQAVTTGGSTEDLHDTAMDFIKAGSGIQGLGIQGHVKEFTKPDPTMMWRRLDRLAETGLELFMTEFDLGWNDDVVRADWFEDAMRAFFAHEALSGVVLWGFWQRMQRYKNRYLVVGDDLQFAEPGQRWVCLVKKEWTTNETFNMGQHVSNDIGLRGFMGDYEIVVRRRGVPVLRQNFTLGANESTVGVVLEGDEGPIEVTEERDYVPLCISHRDRKSLGELYTTSASLNLTCYDSTADQSSVSSSSISVTCPEGSVMIGCSSFHQGRSSQYWRGEQIKIEDGVATCSSSIIPDSPYGNQEGVKVSARCCDQNGLTCDYRQAGPSSPMSGAMAEAVCPKNYTVAACTVSSEHSHINGAYPSTVNLTACLALNGLPSSDNPVYQSGVVSGAVCCKAGQTRLNCLEARSAPSAVGDSDVRVRCQANYVMTGCHVQASQGATAGSYISNEGGTTSCVANTATDQPGKNGPVVAVAVCCTP